MLSWHWYDTSVETDLTLQEIFYGNNYYGLYIHCMFVCVHIYNAAICVFLVQVIWNQQVNWDVLAFVNMYTIFSVMTNTDIMFWMCTCTLFCRCFWLVKSGRNKKRYCYFEFLHVYPVSGTAIEVSSQNVY